MPTLVGNAKFTETVAILSNLAPIAIDGSTGYTTGIQIANVSGGATIPKDVERLVFILQCGVLADTVDMKLQLSAANTMGTPTDITSYAITQVAGLSNVGGGTIKVIEISAAAIAKALAATPTKIFIGALVTVGSTGAGGVVAVLVLGISKEMSAYSLVDSAALVTEVVGD
jgi:hypothetical protein